MGSTTGLHSTTVYTATTVVCHHDVQATVGMPLLPLLHALHTDAMADASGSKATDGQPFHPHFPSISL
jgi:hypothetical protein